VTTSVTDVSDIAAYKDIRRNALLIEIEAWAAKPIDGGS
jgi:hypothetical protein